MNQHHTFYLLYFYSDPKYLLHCDSIYNYLYSLKS